jgi:hypothetical protein
MRAGATESSAQALGVLLAIFDFPMLVAGYRAVIDGQPDMRVVGTVDEPASLCQALDRVPADVVIVDCLSYTDVGSTAFGAIEAIRGAKPGLKIVALDLRVALDADGGRRLCDLDDRVGIGPGMPVSGPVARLAVDPGVAVGGLLGGLALMARDAPVGGDPQRPQGPGLGVDRGVAGAEGRVGRRGDEQAHADRERRDRDDGDGLHDRRHAPAAHASATAMTPRRRANLRSSTRSWKPSFSMMFAR